MKFRNERERKEKKIQFLANGRENTFCHRKGGEKKIWLILKTWSIKDVAIKKGYELKFGYRKKNMNSKLCAIELSNYHE